MSQAAIWQALVPLAMVGLILFRGSRARKLKIEQLWVIPAIILAGVAASFSQQHPPGPLFLALDAVALAAGAALGWQRARFTRLTIDPASHVVTSQTSPVGLVLLVGIFALRYLVRDYATRHAGEWHLSVIDITDVFLLLAAGLVCAQRIEIWIRARRLLAEPRSR